MISSPEKWATMLDGNWSENYGIYLDSFMGALLSGQPSVEILLDVQILFGPFLRIDLRQECEEYRGFVDLELWSSAIQTSNLLTWRSYTCLLRHTVNLQHPEAQHQLESAIASFLEYRSGYE